MAFFCFVVERSRWTIRQLCHSRMARRCKPMVMQAHSHGSRMRRHTHHTNSHRWRRLWRVQCHPHQLVLFLRVILQVALAWFDLIGIRIVIVHARTWLATRTGTTAASRTYFSICANLSLKLVCWLAAWHRECNSTESRVAHVAHAPSETELAQCRSCFGVRS